MLRASQALVARQPQRICPGPPRRCRQVARRPRNQQDTALASVAELLVAAQSACESSVGRVPHRRPQWSPGIRQWARRASLPDRQVRGLRCARRADGRPIAEPEAIPELHHAAADLSRSASSPLTRSRIETSTPAAAARPRTDARAPLRTGNSRQSAHCPRTPPRSAPARDGPPVLAPLTGVPPPPRSLWLSMSSLVLAPRVWVTLPG